MELIALRGCDGQRVCTEIKFLRQHQLIPCALVGVASSEDDMGVLEGELTCTLIANAGVGAGHQAVQL